MHEYPGSVSVIIVNIPFLTIQDIGIKLRLVTQRCHLTSGGHNHSAQLDI